MPSELPKLTKPQMARLVEIGLAKVAWADQSPATTAHLDRVEAVDIAHALPGETLRVVRLTSLGVRVLAGLPGDKFDKFRAMLAEPDSRPRGAAGEGGTP